MEMEFEFSESNYDDYPTHQMPKPQTNRKGPNTVSQSGIMLDTGNATELYQVHCKVIKSIFGTKDAQIAATEIESASSPHAGPMPAPVEVRSSSSGCLSFLNRVQNLADLLQVLARCRSRCQRT